MAMPRPRLSFLSQLTMGSPICSHSAPLYVKTRTLPGVGSWSLVPGAMKAIVLESPLMETRMPAMMFVAFP